MSRSKARYSLLAGAIASVSLLASGCGGSQSPSVASLETTSAGTTGSALGSVPPGGLVAGGSMSTEVGTGAAGVKFAACMRSHGVPTYPDPDHQGVFTIDSSMGIDPSSPLFQKALASCQGLRPPGETLSPAKQQQMRTRLLAFSACMRSHGVPHYPDPTFGPGGMVSQSLSRRETDPNSPIFLAAQKACQRNRGG